VLTKASGKGTWWEGLDPKDLYGIDLADERTKGTWNDEKERTGDSRYGGMADEISNEEYARWYCNKWFNLKFPHKNTHFRRIFRGFRVDRVWWFCLHADGLE
jgi:hypothetical protein